MYIDYDKRIKLIGFIFYVLELKNKRKKIRIIKIVNYLVESYNKDYIINCSKNFSLEKIKYDINQKEAIYSDELFNLVLAGAGSGKTSTIIGKINHLINDKKFLPEDIICFSFTNEAVKNLKDRLKYPVKVYTFHKFCLSFVLNKYNLDNNKLDYVIDEYFSGIIINNKKMIKKVIKCLNKRDYRNYEKYIVSKEMRYLKRQIKIFINLFKSYGYDYSKFLEIKSRRFKNILLIIIDIYTLYLSELNATNTIDLDMLIVKATKEIQKYKLHYKYIIIDEFQDISKIRMDLIKSLANSCCAKIMAVGDDYQSIYNFSGSDISILFDIYKDNATKVIYLKNNYRCCQELVNISTKFIVKNKNQIKKKIISNKYIKKPIIIVKEKENVLEKLLRTVCNSNKNVMVLGRNNNDINKYLTPNMIYQDSKIALDEVSCNIYYKTTHASKGLEADLIILINLTDSLTGFPSKIKHNALSKQLTFFEEYKYASERRLFYVALTRSKGEVYLLSPKNRSCFLKEIIKDNKKNITYLDL